MNSGTRYTRPRPRARRLGLGLGLGLFNFNLFILCTGNSSSEFTQSSLVYILISGLPTILDVGELQTGNSEFTRFLGGGSLE